MKYRKFITLFVIGLTISGQLAGVMYLPSLPVMKIYFNSTEYNTKFVLILYLLGFGCSQLFFGPYSDYKGRKKALIIGLSFSLLGNLFCTFTSSLSILNVSRIFVGFGSGATASVGRAILRDIFDDKNTLIRATSTIGMVTALTPAIGPAIGGFIQQLAGWRFNFLILGLYTLVMLLVCMTSFHESNHKKIEKKVRLRNFVEGFGIVIQHNVFLTSVLSASIAFSGLIAYEISAPFLFEDILGLTPSEFGSISILVALSLSLGSFINRKVTYNSDQRLRFAFLLFIIAAFMLTGSFLMNCSNTISIILPAMFLAAGVGIVFSTAIADALTPFKDHAGSASALFGFSQMMITMLITLVFSFIDITSGLPLAIIFFICGTVGYLIPRVGPAPQAI